MFETFRPGFGSFFRAIFTTSPKMHKVSESQDTKIFFRPTKIFPSSWVVHNSLNCKNFPEEKNAFWTPNLTIEVSNYFQNIFSWGKFFVHVYIQRIVQCLENIFCRSEKFLWSWDIPEAKHFWKFWNVVNTSADENCDVFSICCVDSDKGKEMQT